jgi:hypothetical protein
MAMSGLGLAILGEETHPRLNPAAAVDLRKVGAAQTAKTPEAPVITQEHPGERR